MALMGHRMEHGGAVLLAAATKGVFVGEGQAAVMEGALFVEDTVRRHALALQQAYTSQGIEAGGGRASTRPAVAAGGPRCKAGFAISPSRTLRQVCLPFHLPLQQPDHAPTCPTPLQVCPANWVPGGDTMKPDPKGSLGEHPPACPLACLEPCLPPALETASVA